MTKLVTRDVTQALESAIEHWRRGEVRTARKYIEWALRKMEKIARESANG